MKSRRLVIKATSGPEALERLNQAVTVAATALASGVSVSLWLAGDSVDLAVPGRANEWTLEHAARLVDLRDALIDGGATVTVCGQCAARRSLSADDLVAGVVIRGAASFLEEVMAEGAQALVY